MILPQAVPGWSPPRGCGSGEDAGDEGPAASVVDASATCGALQGLSHRRGSLGQAGSALPAGKGSKHGHLRSTAEVRSVGLGCESGHHFEALRSRLSVSHDYRIRIKYKRRGLKEICIWQFSALLLSTAAKLFFLSNFQLPLSTPFPKVLQESFGDPECLSLSRRPLCTCRSLFLEYSASTVLKLPALNHPTPPTQ